MTSEIWIRIRIRLSTALRAIKALKLAASQEHEQRHRLRDSPKSAAAHGEEANEYDACKREFENELKRLDEGRDI